MTTVVWGEPAPPGFRAFAFDTVPATGFLNNFGDVSLEIDAAGFTVDVNGLIVPPNPNSALWDLHAVLNGTCTGSSYAQYLSFRIQTFTSAGAFYDQSVEMRLEWTNLPGGPTCWGDMSMPCIIPAGGKVGVTVANFNSGDCDVEWQLGGHYIRRADLVDPG